MEEADVGTVGIMRTMGAEPEQPERTAGTGRTEGTDFAAPEDGSLDDPASLEADARTERLDRVAVLYARITAATREFLAAVAECDRHEDWAAEGFGSCAEWLAWRVGLGRNAANERVRVARALERLPKTSEAMSRGEVSFSKVRAITRVATADSEAELLELARSGSTAYLERVVRAWKTLTRDDEARRERVLHRTRRFSVVPDGEGMYVVRGRLTPEVAAVLMRAVDAASDALYRSDEEREETDPAQRRADAVGLLAERALAAGLGGEAAGFDDIAVSGSRAERYQVMLHVEPETLAEEGEPGMSELEDGTRVSSSCARRSRGSPIRCATRSRVLWPLGSAETARRLACDSSVVEVMRGEVRRDVVERAARSAILSVGRRTRSVPPAVRRALEARDRGCRFPGCGGRFTDAHHIVHWADGGETKLTNLVLLCRRHHRRVHEEGWRVCSDATGEGIVFFTPTGKALAAAAPMSALPGRPAVQTATPASPPSALERLTRALAERGVDPDWRTNLPRYRHDVDIPWAVEAAAREALEDACDGALGTGV